jgi:hypothetical protein
MGSVRSVSGNGGMNQVELNNSRGKHGSEKKRLIHTVPLLSLTHFPQLQTYNLQN